MKTLKTLALIGASALAVSAASTAAVQAQPWGGSGYGHQGYHGGYNTSRLTTSYVDSLDWKITNAAQRGMIAWPEARELRGELRSVQNLAWRVQNGQANSWEVRRLETTVSRIEAATTRYAYNDRRDGRYGDGRDGDRRYGDERWGGGYRR